NNSFVSSINQTTRACLGNKSCLDHILVRYKNLKAFKMNVYNTGISDHYTLVMNNFQKVLQEQVSEDYIEKTIDFRSIVSDLNLMKWHNVPSCNDVNMCLNNFYELIIACIKK